MLKIVEGQFRSLEKLEKFPLLDAGDIARDRAPPLEMVVAAAPLDRQEAAEVIGIVEADEHGVVVRAHVEDGDDPAIAPLNIVVAAAHVQTGGKAATRKKALIVPRLAVDEIVDGSAGHVDQVVPVTDG